jgi:alpha-D-ribose 1-methylphosphonate 5-triphosphate synthase subunit PhnH
MKMSDKQAAALEIFRILMKTMSRPGKILKLPGNLTGREPDGVIAVCDTLLDHEVKFSVIGRGTSESLIREIYEETKSEYVMSEEADYVIVAGGSGCGGIRSLSRGTLEFPDRGATVIYPVRSLGEGRGISLGLEGPGISGSVTVDIEGMDRSDLKDIQEMNSEFPMGIDVILIDPAGRVTSLPRSTRMEIKE